MEANIDLKVTHLFLLRLYTMEFKIINVTWREKGDACGQQWDTV